MTIKNLWIIMPVYNEEEAITGVVNEWSKALSESNVNYTLCILNDGSRDNTLNLLQKLAVQHESIKVIDKANSGHGQTCLTGYRMAIEQNADWILQIDSDGQCDPVYVQHFLNATDNYKAIYGNREKRDDGLKRTIVSKFVTLFTFVATGRWVKDANVPYRLIHTDVMKHIVNSVPADFHLANIYVSVLSDKLTKIKWINIHFRDRVGGTASVKTFSFVKHGFKLFRQLKEASSYNS